MQAQSIYRIADVARLYGLSRSTVYREIARGRFPKPVCVTAKIRGWRKADLELWADNLTNPGGQLPFFPTEEGRP